jgi:hypothetical protein
VKSAPEHNSPEQELRDLIGELVDALAGAAAAQVSEIQRSSERRFLSKSALAEHYGVVPRTVKTWREKGCPALRVGRVLMFEVDEVNRWLEREGKA